MPDDWNVFKVTGQGLDLRVRLSSRHLDEPLDGEFHFNAGEDSVVEQFLEKIQSNRIESLDVTKYLGQEMWLALNAPPLDSGWARIRESYSGDGRILLGLRLPGDLEEFPWESLFSPSVDERALARNERFCVARLPEEGLPFRSLPRPAASEVRVLIIAPNGSGLRVENEIAAIERALVPFGVEAERISDATPEKIYQALTTGGRWTVVHYIGHGRINEKDFSYEILVNNDRGGVEWWSAEILSEMFLNVEVDLVVMNSCYGKGSENRDDTLNGMGALLFARKVPAIVAMQYAIMDKMAVVFAESLYSSLFTGMEPGRIDVAVTAARAALARNQGTDHRAFITPVLYLAPGFETILLPAVAVPDLPPPPDPDPDGPQPPLAVHEPVILPEALVDAIAKRLCVPVIGPAILSLGLMRDHVPQLGPVELTEHLASRTGKLYPCVTEIEWSRVNPSLLSSLVQQRVCEHYMFSGREGLSELVDMVDKACRDRPPSELIRRLARWEVPAMFYTYFDGLLDHLQRQSKSTFTKVIRSLKNLSDDVFRDVDPKKDRLLILPCGSVAEKKTLILLGRDHEELVTTIRHMNAHVADLSREEGTCVVFMGVSPCDPVARALASRLIITDMNDLRQGPTFFVWDNPTEVDRAYWEGRYQVRWIKGDLEEVISAMMDVTPA